MLRRAEVLRKDERLGNEPTVGVGNRTDSIRDFRDDAKVNEIYLLLLVTGCHPIESGTFRPAGEHTL